MFKHSSSKFLYPINITIFTVFSITLLILVGVIIGVSYTNSARSAYETADLVMEKNSNQVFMKIETLYEPLLNLTNQTTELPILGEKPTLQNHPAENFLLNTMDSYPQIQIIYMGYEDGDFYEILSCKGNLRAQLQETVQAPADTEFAILRQFNTPGSTTPVRIWKYLNSMRQTIGSRKEQYTGYDPRKRPWYKNALLENISVKTDPYYFTNVKVMGLTISHTIDGNVPGVIGADILMNKLYSYLEGIKAAENEEIFIFNENMFITSDEHGIISMAQTDSETIQAFSNYITEHGLKNEMNFLLDVSDETYLVKIKRLPEKYSNNEYLFIAVPRTEIMGSIIRSTKETAILSIVIMILFLPILMIISRQISAPINKLVYEANKIATFDLEDNIEINTRIKETKKLTDEMASMKRGIRLFNKYVPSQLVQKLMLSGEDVDIGGTTREMTFLFSDIAGFTKISEKCDPQELMKRLSEYFNLLSTIIRDRNGTVDKFIGDAVMAFWNAPLEDIKHIENACLSALVIQQDLEKLHTHWQEKGIEPFITRIGVNTGEAVVGNMGSNDRMNYTAIGDVVNSCSRLEGINKNYGTQIIIGEKVAEKLRNNFITRPLDKVIVKGKTESEVIFELIGLAEDLSGEKLLFASLSTKAFYNFHNREWHKAVVLFHKALELNPGDIQIINYIKQCQEYTICQPDESWDGILKMKVK